MKDMRVLNFADFKPLAARVPRVNGQLNWQDKWGALKVRLAMNRHSYIVKPGIYAIGKPDSHSDVFVTSNYKLTFDIVRRDLDGMNAWILVLDTKGVNVWCAAGKGTFGTAELVRRIQVTSLKDIVSHKRLILPQLGAVGVAAHLVKEQTEFFVTFGPVRSKDIRAFVEHGYKSTPDMRRMDFPWFERLKVVPVEIVLGFKYLIFAFFLLLGLSGIYQEGYSFDLILSKGPVVLLNIFTGFLAGTLFTPWALPHIPFRSFSAKGLAVGLFCATVLFIFNLLGKTVLEELSWFMIISSASSFLAMNFTGSSTYTSLSGVKKEMRVAIPFQIVFATMGLILFVLSRII
jgi:hypothetical protein